MAWDDHKNVPIHKQNQTNIFGDMILYIPIQWKFLFKVCDGNWIWIWSESCDCKSFIRCCSCACQLRQLFQGSSWSYLFFGHAACLKLLGTYILWKKVLTLPDLTLRWVILWIGYSKLLHASTHTFLTSNTPLSYLESGVFNSNALVHHGPLLSHLLGVASHLLSPQCK